MVSEARNSAWNFDIVLKRVFDMFLSALGMALSLPLEGLIVPGVKSKTADWSSTGSTAGGKTAESSQVSNSALWLPIRASR